MCTCNASLPQDHLAFVMFNVAYYGKCEALGTISEEHTRVLLGTECRKIVQAIVWFAVQKRKVRSTREV
jgi:hypothetical protein